MSCLEYIRIHELYTTLYEAIYKQHSKIIIVQCCTENAAYAAYCGIHHTIEGIRKELPILPGMILEEYIHNDYYKYFRLRHTLRYIKIMVTLDGISLRIDIA